MARRHIQINSKAELLLPPMGLPAASSSLDFAGGVRGRVGVSFEPDVKAFFDSFDAPKAAERMPVRNTQRLRAAAPICNAPPPGITGQDELQWRRVLVEDSRTAADLVGLPIDRESYRQLPKARVNVVLRPGYRERGQAAMTKASELQRSDEASRVAARHLRAERTRRRQRAIVNASRQAALQLPVQRAAALEAERERGMHDFQLQSEAAQQGAEDVAQQLPAFEGTTPGLPPATPGPPTIKGSDASMASQGMQPRKGEKRGGTHSAAGWSERMEMPDQLEMTVEVAPTAQRVEFSLGIGKAKGPRRKKDGTGTLPPLH